jgi:hypothetical protein
LEGKPLDRFGGHRPKEEAQRRGDVLAIDDMIFLIGHTAAIVHDAVEHQDRAPPACVDPRGWLRKGLEIGRTHIELPAFIGVRGLEVDHRLLDGQRALIVAPLRQIPIDGTLLQQRLGSHYPPLGGVDPIVLEEPDRLWHREVPAFGIAGPHLQRRDEFTVALELG